MREKKSQATHANQEQNTSITQPSINRPDNAHTSKCNTESVNESVCVWWCVTTEVARESFLLTP